MSRCSRFRCSRFLSLAAWLSVSVTVLSRGGTVEPAHASDVPGRPAGASASSPVNNFVFSGCDPQFRVAVGTNVSTFARGGLMSPPDGWRWPIEITCEVSQVIVRLVNETPGGARRQIDRAQRPPGAMARVVAVVVRELVKKQTGDGGKNQDSRGNERAVENDKTSAPRFRLGAGIALGAFTDERLGTVGPYFEGWLRPLSSHQTFWLKASGAAGWAQTDRTIGKVNVRHGRWAMGAGVDVWQSLTNDRWINLSLGWSVHAVKVEGEPSMSFKGRGVSFQRTGAFFELTGCAAVSKSSDGSRATLERRPKRQPKRQHKMSVCLQGTLERMLEPVRGRVVGAEDVTLGPWVGYVRAGLYFF